MSHLVYLRTFLEAYRTGSLTRAGERLGITQPAASAHLVALEQMLGKPLFVRRARGVTPTLAADDLAHQIAENLDTIETVMASARARSTVLTGTVHIVGPSEYLSATIGPALAPLIADGFRLRIQTGNRARIYAALVDGHADLAITASKPESKAVGFTELARERLLLAASPALFEKARGRAVTAEFLSGLPCLAYDESLPLIVPFFQHVFRKAPALRAAVTTPDLRVLARMVEAGAGWTVLPDYLASQSLAAGAMFELPTRPGPQNVLYLVWNKPALRHPRVVHVRDFILRAITNDRADALAQRFTRPRSG